MSEGQTLNDSETQDLRATVAELATTVRALQDQLEIMQLVAQYGPSVDSGHGAVTASLWTEDGSFDAVPHLEMRGRGDIERMVDDDGHQAMADHGLAHVLTVPHVVLDGDEATGRSYALQLRWDPETQRFWVFRVSANTWRWVRTGEGWKVAARVNAPLDGTPGHRERLAPPRTS